MERPYRLWNEKEKSAIRWRCYGYLEHAQIAGLIEAKRAKIGTVIAVHHAENAKLFGQYTRHVNHVSFMGEKHDYAKPGKHANNVHSIKSAKRRVNKETGEIRRIA